MYGTLFGVWHVWCPTVWAGCSLEGEQSVTPPAAADRSDPRRRSRRDACGVGVPRRSTLPTARDGGRRAAR